MVQRKVAPLIVDWAAGERGRLEGALERGPVVVAVSDCDVRPLWDCVVVGTYYFEPSSMRQGSEKLATLDALAARIPTGLARFSANIEHGESLSVDKTTIGRFESNYKKLAQAELSGSCEGATHFVSAVSVGAFAFATQAKTSAGAGADGAIVGAHAEHSAKSEVLSRDGDPALCTEATADGPPAGCAAPIELELTPILPSLDLEALREMLKQGTTQVMEQCLGKGPLGTMSPGVDIVIQPSGTIVANIRDGSPWAGTQAYSCILQVWNRFRLKPFSGHPQYAQATIYVAEPCAPGPGCTNWPESIERLYREAQAATLTPSLAQSLGAWAEAELGAWASQAR